MFHFTFLFISTVTVCLHQPFHRPMSVTTLFISLGLTGGLMVEEGWRAFNFIRWHFALSALLLLLQDGEHSRGNNTSTSPDGHKSGNQQTFRILKNAPPLHHKLIAHSYTAAACTLNLLYACGLQFYVLGRPSLQRIYLHILYVKDPE